MEGYYIIRTYESGNVGEKIKFWAPGKKPDRMTRKAQSDAAQITRNERNSVRALARIINANFSEGDCFALLTYDDKGLQKLADRIGPKPFYSSDDILAAADAELTNFFRRVNRELDKRGLPHVKSVSINSDMDGETGRSVRVHHHVLVPKEAEELIRKKWTAGNVSTEALSSQDDYTPIADYLLKQIRRKPNEAGWRTSRGNIVRPVPVDRIARGDGIIRVPTGAQIIFMSQVQRYDNGNSPQYVRYSLPARRRKKNKKPIPECGEGE